MTKWGDTIGREGGGGGARWGTTIYIYIYMIPVRPSPPPLPPPNGSSPPPPPLCGVVVGCFPPPLWCGVVWLWVASPLPVVWCGSGVGFGGSPPSPPVAWCGLGGSPLHVWILVFLWLVVGYLLPTCLLTIIALLTVGARSL